MTQSLHIALRVPLVTKIYGVGIDTIEAHNAVIRDRGAVALAKFGAALSDRTYFILHDEVNQGNYIDLFQFGK